MAQGQQQANGLSWWERGTGDPLILIHGGALDHTIFSRVADELEDAYQLLVVDRPGYGGSSALRPATISEEAAAVAHVLEGLDAQVAVFGHSHGAWVALELALINGSRINSLVLYEPPQLTALPREVLHDILQDLRDLLASGDTARLIERFFVEIVNTPPATVATWRSTPTWDAMLARASGVVDDVSRLAQHSFDPARFQALDCPLTLFVGSESPEELTVPAHTLNETVHGARLVTLEGQGHGAIVAAPTLLAAEIRTALSIGN